MADSLENIVRKVISQFGTDILKEERFVNILMDYGVLKDCPETRDAFRLMIRKGYSNLILSLGMSGGAWARFKSAINGKNYVSKPVSNDWLKKEKEIVKKFVVECGFSNETAEYAFDLILFGVGWIDNVRKRPISPVVISNKQFVQSKKHSSPKSSVNQFNTIVKPHSTAPISYSSITDTQFLIVKVSPSNAYVYVDGVQQSVKNGMTAVELPVGTHNYEISCVSYHSKTGNVTLQSDKKAIVDVALELDCKTANVVIKTVEPQTEIFIDGIKYGVNEWKGQLSFGTYDVEFCLEKHYSEKRGIHILSNNPLIINSLPMKPICGNLNVNVTPYGSKIFVNGKEMGETPLLLKNIIVGTRNVRIRTVEGTEYEENVEIKENQVSVISHDIPSLFYTDYSMLKIGDFYYEDGSFSHEKAEGKLCVGIVFSLNPSDEEKKRGWCHGQIISIESTNYYGLFGKYGKENNTDALNRYVTDTYMGINNGYVIAHDDIIRNNADYSYFLSASSFNRKLPIGMTSGWYLPCIAQLYEVARNLYGINANLQIRCKPFVDVLGSAISSSINSEKKYWVCKHFYGSSRLVITPMLAGGIHPVASF